MTASVSIKDLYWDGPDFVEERSDGTNTRYENAWISGHSKTFSHIDDSGTISVQEVPVNIVGKVKEDIEDHRAWNNYFRSPKYFSFEDFVDFDFDSERDKSLAFQREIADRKAVRRPSEPGEIYSASYTPEFWKKFWAPHIPWFMPDGAPDVFKEAVEKIIKEFPKEYGKLKIDRIERDPDRPDSVNVSASFTPVMPLEWITVNIDLSDEEIIP